VLTFFDRSQATAGNPWYFIDAELTGPYMTTLSYLPTRISRLFTRVDAAGATGREPKLALAFWRKHRGGSVFPSKQVLAKLPESIADHSFMATRIGGKPRDWNLAEVGPMAAAWLEPNRTAQGLLKLKDRRMAVRFRRFFELVTEMGEPLSTLFPACLDGEKVEVEVVAAPWSSNETKVDGIFGCMTTRRHMSYSGEKEKSRGSSS
jgi:hypothetical protein